MTWGKLLLAASLPLFQSFPSEADCVCPASPLAESPGTAAKQKSRIVYFYCVCIVFLLPLYCISIGSSSLCGYITEIHDTPSLAQTLPNECRMCCNVHLAISCVCPVCAFICFFFSTDYLLTNALPAEQTQFRCFTPYP